MKKFLVIFLIALIAFPILSYSTNIENRKHFACKLIMNNGKVFQTLLLGKDWKEISQNQKPMINNQKTFEIIDFNFNDQNLYLEINSVANETFNLQVYSIDGSFHYQNKIFFQTGYNSMNIKIPDNFNRIKILTISDNYNIKTIKLIK